VQSRRALALAQMRSSKCALAPPKAQAARGEPGTGDGVARDCKKTAQTCAGLASIRCLM
jgi:hypothetical protein